MDLFDDGSVSLPRQSIAWTWKCYANGRRLQFSLTNFSLLTIIRMIHNISTYSKVPFRPLSSDRTRSDSQFLLAAPQPLKNEGFCSILLWNLLGPHRLAFYWNVRWVLWLFRPLFWILTNRHLFYQKNSCFGKYSESSRNQVCDFGGELLLII